MSKKWSPNKEYKRQQHIVPSYIKNVMNDNKGKDGPKGVISNKGNGSEDGSSFPDPNRRDKVGHNNGESSWKDN